MMLHATHAHLQVMTQQNNGKLRSIVFIFVIMPESVVFSFLFSDRQCAPIDVGAIFQLPAHIVGLRRTLTASKIYKGEFASVDLQQHGGDRGQTVWVGLVTGGVWGRGRMEGGGGGAGGIGL